MEKDLHAFFVSYQTAFDKFEAHDITKHYLLPCVIADNDGLHCYQSLQQLRQKFTDNVEAMKCMGYSRSILNINNIKTMDDNKAMVDIQWTVNLSTGPFVFGTLYLCEYSSNQWHIYSATVYQQVS